VLTIFTTVQRTTRYKPTHRSSNLVVLFLVMTPPGQTGRRRHYVLDLSVRSSVRPSVRSSVTKLVNTIFYKRMKWNDFDANWSKWSTGQKREKVYFWDQEVKGQGHMRPNIILEAWRRHHLRPLLVEWLF